MRTRSSIRLLLIAAGVVALVLAIAPVSFAGEDPGPTQNGEVQPAPTPAPAATPAPTSSPASNTVAKSKDTGKAVGGIQTGAGGMAVTAWSPTLALALAVGGVMFLLAGAGSTLRHRRAEG